MNAIINTRADLDALRATPAYAEALRNILGSTATWVNTAPEGSPPAWQLVTVLSTIERMGFLSINDLLTECAAAGVTPPAPPSAPSAPPPSKADLIAYAGNAKDKTLIAGIVVNAAASGQAAVDVHCDGTPETRGDLAGFYAWGSANPAGTRAWLDETGTLFTLTGAQFVTLAQAVGNWVDNVYAQLGGLTAQINSGAITTTAQIDAATWPTS